MKRLSLKGLAEFMLASERRKRAILHCYKYPHDRILAFHSSKAEINWLINQANELEALARISTGRRKTRLQHNSRALRQYALYFGTREFEILADKMFELVVEDVTISVYPDLHVLESNREKYIKLEFAIAELSDDLIAILSQTLFEAVKIAGQAIPASCILLFDVPRGAEHRGARMRTRMRNEIVAACQNISAIWDTI